MLITVENISKKRQGQVYIKDYALYLLSNGTEGMDILEPISNYDYITYEITEINNKYKDSYQMYLRPMLTRLARKIETFLTDFPDFLMNKDKYYTKFKIPKKKPDEHGNTRWRHLINPAPELKLLQKEISDTLIGCGMLAHNAAHAFRKNRDYYTNAEAHKNNKHIINLDLKDFFDSITEEILYENLKLHPLFNIPLIIDDQEYPLLENIVKICTYEGSTPQGSPASPFLSNIIMTNFDFRLRKLLNNEPIKCIYTRYADDMSFSSKKSQDISHIIHLVEQV